MAIFIVDLPIDSMVIFHRFFCMFSRGFTQPPINWCQARLEYLAAKARCCTVRGVFRVLAGSLMAIMGT